MENIRELVFAALDNAQANGYDPHNDTVEEIVHDLQDYDADLEGTPSADLTPHVVEWLTK